MTAFANDNEGLQPLIECIKGAYRAFDLDGTPRGELAVRVKCESHTGWFLLRTIDLLQGRIPELARMVAHMGPVSALGARKSLVELGSWLVSRATKELRVVTRPGHHVLKLGDTEFELLADSGQLHWIDQEPPVRVIFDERCVGNRTRIAAGTPAEWSRNVGKAFAGNPNLIVGLGCALSAPLISPLGLPTLMYGVVGASSSGKSLLLRLVQSLYKSGAELEAATGTVLGIHQLATEYRDKPLLLDETRQQKDADGFFRFLFDMGNNAVRKVGSASQEAIRGGQLRSALITTNEKTLDELAARQGISIDAGIQARMFEVQLEGKNGIFDKVPAAETPAQFAERLQDLSEKYFGSVWPVISQAWAQGNAALTRATWELLMGWFRLRYRTQPTASHSLSP